MNDGQQERVRSTFVETEMRGQPIEFRIDTGDIISRGVPVQGVRSIGVTLPDGSEFTLDRDGSFIRGADNVPPATSAHLRDFQRLFRNEDFRRQIVERVQQEMGLQATTILRRIDAMLNRAAPVTGFRPSP